MNVYTQNRINHLQSQFSKSTVKSFQAHNSKIHSVAWNVDGKRLASGSTDKTVAVFAFENREKLVFWIRERLEAWLLLLNILSFPASQKKVFSKVTRI
jgi:WD40 repeat protein